MLKHIVKKAILWSARTRLLAYPRIVIARVLNYVRRAAPPVANTPPIPPNPTIPTTPKNGVWTPQGDPERFEIFNLIAQIQQENEMLLGTNEAYQIFVAVKNIRKIDGDLAEVGTYRGGSAKLICEAKGDSPLHLFDTFEGLPKLTACDDPNQFHRGQFSSAMEDVKRYLNNYRYVHFPKGNFPSTGSPVINNSFSFVHLDVDLYETTLASLSFFYPRMSKGGVVISHDYIYTIGVKRAFDEFFSDKPEPVIELFSTQCLIVKV